MNRAEVHWRGRPQPVLRGQKRILRTKRLFVLGMLLLAHPGWSFNLTRHSVPEAELSTGSLPRDAILAIDSPKFMPADKADHLAPDEQVIGVVLNGEARAYPIRILNGHEIANDEIRGQPIAVTW